VKALHINFDMNDADGDKLDTGKSGGEIGENMRILYGDAVVTY
jgi:hypothetical protein